MLDGNVDEWPASRFGKVTGRRGKVGAGGERGVEEQEREILMKLQDGLIDLRGCMLQWRNAVKTDASRLVSEEPLKDNESHHQETWPSQHMKPPAHQAELRGSKPRAGGNIVTARRKEKKKDNMRQEWICRCFNSYSLAWLSIMEWKWMVTRQLVTHWGSCVVW